MKNTVFNIMMRPMPRTTFLVLCILTGVIAGLGAVGFRVLIAFVHNLFFFGRLSIVYNANLHTPASPWGPFVVLVPVVGSLGVTLLVTRFAPEAKGHGVPEVMDAEYYGRGVIRPVVALFKALASALSIGTGGSVGREGPIAQIGSAFGSTISRFVPMTQKQRLTLIAAGAGGGIAATFNTPIGGILFAVELLLHEVSVATLVPVAVATVTATYVGQLFFGVHPSFVIPELQQPYFRPLDPWLLAPYAVLGLLMGLAATLYIRSLYAVEDFFERSAMGGPYGRHLIGMLGVGVLMTGLMYAAGHYYVEGVGYSVIQDVLTGRMNAVPLLLLALFGLKLLATCLTLGSGGSGGIFSPALILGASAGGAFGIALQHLMPNSGINPATFAVAGMAGMVGGATGAAMTSIVMIFEMTLDYSVILPMTITVAISYGLRTLLSRESIYTLKLVRRGHSMPAALQVNMLHVRRALDAMRKRIVTVSSGDGLDALDRLANEHQDVHWFVVVDDGKVLGVAPRDYASSAPTAARSDWHSVADVMRRDFVFASQNELMVDVVTRMHTPHAVVAVVLGPGGRPPSAEAVVGIVTWECVAAVLEDSVDLFSEYRAHN
jgi:chloride channel protein, CIC family